MSAPRSDPFNGKGYSVFAPAGIPLNANAVALQADGKIVVAGVIDAQWGIDGCADIHVTRFNANGTLDGTFGTGGFKLGPTPTDPVFHNFWGQAVALQSDGTIIVAGIDFQRGSGDTAHPLLMRFDP